MNPAQMVYKRNDSLPRPVPVFVTTAHRQPASPEVLPKHIAARFGRRLRVLRKEANMTQLQMAIRFGIDRSFISDLERGRKSVSLPILEVFALGFELTLSDLLNDL